MRFARSSTCRNLPIATMPASIEVVLTRACRDDALAVTALLPREGFAVTCASGADEALRLMSVPSERRCLLVDVSGGLAELIALRALKVGVAIVAIAPSVSAGDAALAAGAQDYVTRDQLGTDVLAQSIRSGVEHMHFASELDAVERLRSTSDAGPVGIVLVGVRPEDEGVILEANRAWTEMVGFDVADVVGRRISEFIHHDDSAAHRAAFRKLIHSGSSATHAERRFLHADGHSVWCKVTAALVHDAAGLAHHAVAVAEDVSERKQGEEALAQAYSAIDDAVLGIALLGLDGKHIAVNRHYAETFGRSTEGLVGRPWQDTIHPLDHAVLASARHRALEGERVTVDVRGLRCDGSTFDLEATLAPSVDADARLRGVHQFVRDISARKAGERALRDSEERFRTIVETANEGIWRIDGQGKTTFVNRRLADLLGYDVVDMLGRPADRFAEPGLWPDLGSESPAEHWNVPLRCRDGSRVWALLSVSPLAEAGFAGDVLVMVTDVTRRRRAEEELAHAALHDPLTGLPNRLSLERRLARAIGSAPPSGGLVGVFFIDVDRFKSVNDGYGHVIGDEILRVLAVRLAAARRHGDTLARFSADEFVMACEMLDGEREAIGIAQRLVEALAKPIGTSVGSFALSGSVGVALGRHGEIAAEDLVRDADTAMYRTKDGGGAGYTIFEARMRATLVRDLEHEQDLKRAIDADELCVYYQPIVQLPEEAVTSFEALVRWEHPERGLLAPDEFISLAERTGLIVPLGQWVLRSACRRIATWTRETEAPDWAHVAVNVSAHQLASPAFVRDLRQILADTGIDPRRLSFEVTETALLEHASVTVSTLQEIRALGIRVVLDDFGTGYSSLGYLNRFPVDGLKLDRAFVCGANSAFNRPIVEAVIGMAHSLDLTLVAEGVETAEQGELLVALGCDYAQGYLFARPMPGDRVESWVAVPTQQLPERARTALASTEECLGLGDTAALLGVSPGTVRRWADQGRLPSRRTEGGHRRFAVADLRRESSSTLVRPKLRLGGGTDEAQPVLADLLEQQGEPMTAKAAKLVYAGRAFGWFATQRAHRFLIDWSRSIATAARRGDAGAAQNATATLLRLSEAGGGSLVEASLFLERFAAVTDVQLSEVAGPAECGAARGLFAVLRRRILVGR